MMNCHGRTYFPESYMWVYVEQYWFKHNLFFWYYTFRQIFYTCWWFELSRHWIFKILNHVYCQMTGAISLLHNAEIWCWHLFLKHVTKVNCNLCWFRMNIIVTITQLYIMIGMTVTVLWGSTELTALYSVVVLHTLSLNNHSVIYGILVCNTWCLLQCLTLPSRANKVFPYHVRTTQIGVMQVQEVTDPDSTFPFRHHQYAPSAPPRPCPNMQPLVGEWVTDVPFELFTVSHSVTTDAVSASYLSVIITHTFFTH